LEEEIQSIKKNQTYDVMKLPYGRKAL